MHARRACLAVAVGFLATAGLLGAQTRIMIGPYVGVNYTTIAGSDVTDAGYKTGLTAGGILQANFADPVFFRTGILYSQRGTKTTDEGTKIKLKENFVEVPLLLGFNFPMEGSRMKPFVMAGGLVGYKVSCDVSGTDSGTSVSLKCDELGEDVKSTNFGVVGGGGLMFPAAGGTMLIDASYLYGLTKIAEGDSDAKHRGFTVGIGYLIPFGH